MVPQAKQKFAMRHVVAAGSVLVLMAAFFVYFNFGNSEISKAKGKNDDFVITYHTADLRVPGLLLVDQQESNRIMNSCHKSQVGAKKKFVSISDSVAVVVKSVHTEND